MQLPCLIAQKYFNGFDGAQCLLLIDKEQEHLLRKSGLKAMEDYLLSEQIDEFINSKIQIINSVEFVAWYHTNGVTLSINTLNSLNKYNKSVFLSFLPDGFSNTVWSGEIYKEIIRGIESTPQLGQFYLFFSENNISKKAIDWMNVAVVSREFYVPTLLSVYNEKQIAADLQGFSANMDLKQKRDVIFIPIRPWCSKFHGDKYDFGDGARSLADIYRDILSYCDISNSVILLKRDSRLEEFQNEVVKILLNTFPNAYDITDFVDKELPFDAIYMYLQKLFPGNKSVITLDSSTPFPLVCNRFQQRFVLGASFSKLKCLEATSEQLRYISTLSERTYSLIKELSDFSGKLLESNEPALGLRTIDLKEGYQ